MRLVAGSAGIFCSFFVRLGGCIDLGGGSCGRVAAEAAAGV